MYAAMENEVKAFEIHMYEEEKSQHTIEKYMRDVRGYLVFAGNEALTRQTVLRYKNHLFETKAITSANSMIASLNAFFRFLGKTELCVKYFKVQREVFCPEEKELKKEEYERLVETARRRGNERLCLILQTICATGMRVSELQYVTVEAARSGEVRVRCKGKTRTIFIVKKLRGMLLAYARKQGISSGMIFITGKGKAVSRTSIWRDMKLLCKEAGVPPERVFPHNLRHLFARVFYRLEKDMAKLADILGHSNINTTRIYIVSSGKEHRKRMEAMDLVVSGRGKFSVI